MWECVKAAKRANCMISKKDQISVEHIVQDAGSPGIEEFAEKMGEWLLRKYGGRK